MKGRQGGPSLKYVVRQRYGEGGGSRKILGTLWSSSMHSHCWSHGACETWQKHAPCITMLPNQMCVRPPDAIQNQELIVPPLSAHPSRDRNPLGHTGPDMSAKLTPSIISG